MFRTIVASVALVALSAVAAAAQVRVDYDRHKDFGKYRTFDVEVGPLVRSDGAVDDQNTLAEDRLRRAVAGELQARGLEATEVGADLLVRVSGRETERTDIVGSGFSGYPGYWGPGFRYRRWGYWRPYGYWGGPYFDDVWTRRYLEGSLTIDIVERDTGSLVYRAQVSREVGKDLEKHVTKAMDSAFKKFPVKERAN
jgi:Domain of unknown function (DUF4136)